MAQKIIITLWRGQINQLDLQQKSQPIICRINYANQSKKSKKADTKKGMVWKETFIFNLRKDPDIQTDIIKLDFIKLQQDQQIHFAQEVVVDTIAFAHSSVQVNVKYPTKGALPAKAQILDQQNRPIGKIFIQYQILKSQVTYLVQKQMDFHYMMKLSAFKVIFLRPLKRVPSFYLIVKIGQKEYKQDFAFDQQGGIYMYNYPLKIYLKKETEMDIILQIKDFYGKDYYDDSYNSYQTSKTSKSKAQSITKNEVKNKDKNPIDLNVGKLVAIMDLNFKKNTQQIKKLPLSIPIGSGKRQIGSIQFNIQTFFRTKQQLMQLQQQLKSDQVQKQIMKSKPQVPEKKKKIQAPKNGIITVNSIIGKLQPFNQQLVQNKDFSVQIKIGKQSQFSSILQNPGRQLIFIDTFTFKRTWQQLMKLTILIHNQNGQKIPAFFSEISLRDLFQIGRYLGKRLPIKDQSKNYCGQMIIDIVYSQQVKEKQTKQQLSFQKGPVKTVEEILKQKRQLKRKEIEQRLKKKEQQKLERQQHKKLKNSFDLMTSIPTFPQQQLMLPPLRTNRNSAKTTTNTTNTTSTISPRGKKHNYIYNNGGSISFSRSPRFSDGMKQQPDSYLYNGASDFDNKRKRGPSIGMSQRSDFTKAGQSNPGAGRYHIPTLWDKYRQ